MRPAHHNQVPSCRVQLSVEAFSGLDAFGSLECDLMRFLFLMRVSLFLDHRTGARSGGWLRATAPCSQARSGAGRAYLNEPSCSERHAQEQSETFGIPAPTDAALEITGTVRENIQFGAPDATFEQACNLAVMIQKPQQPPTLPWQI